ncbi:MAG: metallophosphoesterase [Chloroflexota bacterium]
MTDAPPPSGPRSIARSVVLGTVAFVATFLLLFGLLNVARRSAGGEASAPPFAAATPSAASGPIDPAESGSPSALPTISGDPVLVGAGDIADCGLDSGAATAALLAGIAGTVFTAGDNAYPSGTAAQFRDCYGPFWGRQLERTRPAAGNHDWETRDLAGYLGYFGSRAGPADTSWYSYALGPWHVIVLDSDCSSVGGCGPDSPQGRWLASDLAASTARCTLAIWHQPRFSSGEHGNDPSVAPFWRALYDAGADLVINGHDHDYERFAPQDPEGKEDRLRGIREFVVGTGGAALRDFTTQSANSELRAAVSHGVIRLVLHPGSYGWSFLPTKPGFTDAGSGPCH